MTCSNALIGLENESTTNSNSDKITMVSILCKNWL